MVDACAARCGTGSKGRRCTRIIATAACASAPRVHRSSPGARGRPTASPGRGASPTLRVFGQGRAVILPELRHAAHLRGPWRPDARRRDARQPRRPGGFPAGEPRLDDEPRPVAGDRGRAAALRQHEVGRRERRAIVLPCAAGPRAAIVQPNGRFAFARSLALGTPVAFARRHLGREPLPNSSRNPRRASSPGS